MDISHAIPVKATDEISAADALWAIIKKQSRSVKKSIAVRLIQEEAISAQEAERKRQEAIVKDSLERAFHELRTGQAKHDARQLFS